MQLQEMLVHIYQNSLIEIVTLGYVRIFYGTVQEALAALSTDSLRFSAGSEVVSIVPFEAETDNNVFTVANQVIVRF